MIISDGPRAAPAVLLAVAERLLRPGAASSGNVVTYKTVLKPQAVLEALERIRSTR